MSAAYDAAIVTVEPTLQIPRLKFGGLGAANALALAREIEDANERLPALKHDYLTGHPERAL